jgi:beta-phosphoglucomutase
LGVELQVKLILFDLDGVLVSAKDIHYEALNRALGEYALTKEEHGRYDGLTTRTKLDLLTTEKGLPQTSHEAVWQRKQKITLEMFADLEKDR